MCFLSKCLPSSKCLSKCHTFYASGFYVLIVLCLKQFYVIFIDVFLFYVLNVPFLNWTDTLPEIFLAFWQLFSLCVSLKLSLTYVYLEQFGRNRKKTGCITILIKNKTNKKNKVNLSHDSSLILK